MIQICDYGCGKEGKYHFKNGKWCCEDNYLKCPLSKTRFIGKLHPMYGKHHSTESNEKNRQSTIGGLNPFLLIENKDKKLCSLGCGKEAKYIGKYGKYYCSEFDYKCEKRIELNSVSHKEDNISEVFDNPENLLCDYGCGKPAKYILKKKKSLCCEKTHAKCPIIRIKNGEGTRNEVIHSRMYLLYVQEVLRLTEMVVRRNKDRIKDIELRGNKHKKHLDHKFSIYEGFINKIDPRIISNINNLVILDEFENISKRKKCSITRDELFDTFEEWW